MGEYSSLTSGIQAPHIFLMGCSSPQVVTSLLNGRQLFQEIVCGSFIMKKAEVGGKVFRLNSVRFKMDDNNH